MKQLRAYIYILLLYTLLAGSLSQPDSHYCSYFFPVRLRFFICTLFTISIRSK